MMTIKEREQIIKDLQEIVDNYSGSWKRYDVLANALAIIKELTEEIKDLEVDYERVYEQAEADIRGNIADGGMSCHWCMDKTKADTVKRMWYKIDTNHRVSTVHYIGHAEPTITYEFTNWELDQMVKEILEGKNDV